MTSEANSSYSPLFLGREHGREQFYKLKNSYKINEKFTINFSYWLSGEKGNISAKKYLGLARHFNDRVKFIFGHHILFNSF